MDLHKGFKQIHFLDVCQYVKQLTINPFYDTYLFLFLLKTAKKLWLFGAFTKHEMELIGWKEVAD